MTVDSDITEAELLRERQNIEKGADAADLPRMEHIALTRLTAYLDGKYPVSEEFVPLFFAFIKTFKETQNKDLFTACVKAEAKIAPDIDAFDRANGLNVSKDLSTADIERNMNSLDHFESMNPFEKESKKLKFPLFDQIHAVISRIELTDDDGNPDPDAAEAFADTLTEAAKLRTYMALCLSKAEISAENYCRELLFQMEKALVVLFVTDKAADHVRPNESTRDEIISEFKKLTDSL